jgi:hypothetical protein
MAFPAIAGTIANVNSSAVLAIYVMDTTSNKWQTLGELANSKIHIEEFTVSTGLRRNRTNKAYSFTASTQMLQCALQECELLDSLRAGTNLFLFKLADAVAAAGAASAGWVKVSAAQVNVKPRIVVQGGVEGTRKIELEWSGSFAKTDAAEIELLTPTLAAADFAGSGDSGTAVFYGIGTYTAATDGGSPTPGHICSAAASSVKLDIAGGSGVTIAPVSGLDLTISPLATEDDLKRPITVGYDIALAFNQMSTLNADLLLLGNATSDTAKAIVTMIDGMVFTIDNQTGIQAALDIQGDFEKDRTIPWKLNGAILTSALDGIVS